MLDTIRPLFYIFVIIANFYIYKFVISLERQRSCPYNSGWKPENLKLLAQIGIIIGMANLFLPCNTVLYKIPLVGTGLAILLFGIVIMEIFTLVMLTKSLSDEPDARKQCQLDQYSGFVRRINSIPLIQLIIYSIIIVIALLYL